MKKMIITACFAMLSLCYVAAEGYQVNSQSAKQAGMGHVGAALKLGAESMHFNPAGLGFMKNTIDLSAGVSGVFSSGDFTDDDGYKRKIDNDPSTPLYFYGAFKIYDFMSAGVSVNNPYGSSMNWGKHWRGAHLVQDISLKAFSIQPTIAFKIGDRLSIGAGMMLMFGNFELSRALMTYEDLTVLSKHPLLGPAVTPIMDKYKDLSPASATLTGDAKVKIGYNIGAMFDVTDRITIGVSYRSKVKMRVGEGTAVLSYANESELKPILGAVLPALDQGTFEASLPLPSNLNVGLSYKPIDRLLLSAEVQFVGWGAYKELNVHFHEEALQIKDINAKKDYKNTRIYRIGGQFATTKRLDLRLGVYLDETPVKDEYLNPETPSMTKLGISTGLSFRPLDRLSVDFAFAYTTGFGRDGSYTDKSLVTQEERKFGGHYEIRAFTPTIGLAYSF